MSTTEGKATYDRRGFQPYDGPRQLPRPARTIAVAEIALMWRGRWFKRLAIMALVPALVLSVRVYTERIASQFGADLALGGDYYLSLFEAELIFVAVMMATVASDLIAKDTLSGAHSLYFARPLRPWDYLKGKLAAALFAMGAVTLVPTIILAGAQLIFVRKLTFADTLGVLGLGLAYACLVAFGAGLIILLLSAWGRRGRNVAITWLALFFGSGLIASILYNTIAPTEAVRLIAIREVFLEAGRFLFGGTDNPGGIAILGGVIVAAGTLLWSRITTLATSGGGGG